MAKHEELAASDSNSSMASSRVIMPSPPSVAAASVPSTPAPVHAPVEEAPASPAETTFSVSVPPASPIVEYSSEEEEDESDGSLIDPSEPSDDSDEEEEVGAFDDAALEAELASDEESARVEVKKPKRKNFKAQVETVASTFQKHMQHCVSFAFEDGKCTFTLEVKKNS